MVNNLDVVPGGRLVMLVTHRPIVEVVAAAVHLTNITMNHEKMVLHLHCWGWPHLLCRLLYLMLQIITMVILPYP
jgi:hypothetical protein